MITPLGLDEETWKKRNEVAEHNYGKHKSWKAGVKSGKHGASAADNPYKISDDIHKLLRQRTYWEIGRELGTMRPSKHPHKHKKNHKQLEKIEQLVKPKKKHKHHAKHKS